MTDRQLNNRIIQSIEAQLQELEAQTEAIRAELKADLESKGEDEHNTGSFIIRWDVFTAYRRESVSRRFTIA